MRVDSAELSERERLLDEVVTSYLRAVDAGQWPDRPELLARHPDLAAELNEFFADQDQVQKLAAPLRALAPAGQGSAGHSFGDFEVEEEIGRGGMGIVYRARQKRLNRTVALKVLPFAATMDPRQLRRFHNEARAAACLHHTNIVPVYDVGSERGVHYYAMQLIEGQDLASATARLRGQPDRNPPDPGDVVTVSVASGRPALPGADARSRGGLYTEHSANSREYFRTVARLGIQAAEALDHAHQLGVVHRDIKPANLLVDAAGRLWVTDFGLAQIRSDTRLTRTGDLVGTLRYMSPEQALAKRAVADHRTDIYSLGATLYELLTLEPVFAGKDRQELLRLIAFEEPRRPRQRNRAIPRELETVVLKALEKEPADRYATAKELADDLRRFLEDRPVRARPPTLVQRAAKWSRRHRFVVWAAVAFLALAAAGSATSAWLIYQEYRAKVTALRKAEQGEADLKVANDNLGEANRRKDAETARAERNAVLRLRALDEVIRALTGPRLRRAGQTALVREMLEQLVPLFDEVLRSEDQDDATREQQGVAWNALAVVRRALGRDDEALDAAERAAIIYRALAGRPDRRRAADAGLATALNFKGALLGLKGQYGQAIDTLKEAATLLTELVDKNGADLRLRYQLALVHNNWGNCLAQSAAHRVLSIASVEYDAVPHYEKAIVQFAELAEARPNEILYRDWHARSLANLGLFFLNTGRAGAAQDRTAKALDRARSLASEFRDEIDARECLAVCLSNDGTVRLRLKDAATAEERFTKALALYEGLQRQVPASLEFHWSRAMSESNLGAALAAGRPEDRGRAADCFARAARTYEELQKANPENRELRRYVEENRQRQRALLKDRP